MNAQRPSPLALPRGPLLGLDTCSVPDWSVNDGNSVFVRNLAVHLDRLAAERAFGFDVYCGPGGVRDGVRPHGVRQVPRLPLCAPLHRTVRYGLSLTLALRRPSTFVNVASSVQPRWIAVPHLTVVYDVAFALPQWEDYFTPGLRAFLRANTERALRTAARVVAISRCTRDDVVGRFGIDPARVCIIHPGYDDARFSEQEGPADPKVLQALDSTPYFLAVGTVQPRKNYARLIEAFVSVRRRLRLPHRLVIVGATGWAADDVIALAGRHAHEGVVLWGQAASDEVPALMRHAAAFVFPALYEGFGMPLLEAMACGAPVVASNSGPIPEVVDDAGMLVDPESVGALERALERIVQQDGVREQLRAAGRRRVRRFSWRGAAEQFLELAAGMAAAGSTGRAAAERRA